ncbi:hypothetical protein [Cellulomonas gilvus]|nr:hypothetical protein [Cellulomonas gilvus]
MAQKEHRSRILMHRDEDGQFVVAPEEMFMLRQGLFITKYHLDPTFEDDLHALTGVTPEEFAALLAHVDELGRPWI